VFDNTQSTVEYADGVVNKGEPFKGRATNKEDNVRERDFTPLKDKLG
jgi:hypothetical protein